MDQVTNDISIPTSLTQLEPHLLRRVWYLKIEELVSYIDVWNILIENFSVRLISDKEHPKISQSFVNDW